MPIKPPKPCPVPGCGRLIPAGTSRCREHASKIHQAVNQKRPSYYREYGTARWKKLRAWVLLDSPLCAECNRRGETVPATVVDHRTPVAAGGAMYEIENLQALCKPCHARKTGEERRGGAAKWEEAEAEDDWEPSW